MSLQYEPVEKKMADVECWHPALFYNETVAGRRTKEVGGTCSGAAAFTPDDARLQGDTLLFFPSLGPAKLLTV